MLLVASELQLMNGPASRTLLMEMGKDEENER